MTSRTAALAIALASALYGQTQVDLSRQARGVLSISSGGTNATSQIAARTNVGTPKLIATDFAGADLGAQVNAAFASFPAGTCGTVMIPSGTFTYSSTIYVPSGCILEGTGRGAGVNENTVAATQLIYNGPPATSAVVLMNSDMTPSGYATVRDLTIVSNAGICPNDGMLTWNPAAGGSNKWQCYDGTSFTAAIPHLAGIQHGQTDPIVLFDGTHNRIVNVDIRGTTNINTKGQGGFHFGVYLNGCEECVLESVYAANADDGFMLGPASNGVLLNQITARVNRRSGLHYRGFNSILCNMCLFESNQWVGHTPDPTKYGAGIRAVNENLTGFYSQGVAGLRSIQTYFEANWVDVFNDNSQPAQIEIDNFLSTRGTWGNNTSFTRCTIPDASLLTFSMNSGHVNIGCDVNSGSFNIIGNPTVVYTDRFGALVTKINRGNSADPAEPRADVFEYLVDDAFRYLYFRGKFYSEIRLDSHVFSDASSNPATPRLSFGASKWTGTSTNYRWGLGAESQEPNGAPETTSGIYMNFNGSRQFGFREGGVLHLTQMQAKLASPTAVVQPSAGTGAACSVDTSLGVSNMSGQLTLTTGSAAWGAGAQCIVTFDSTLNGWGTLTPANAAAAAALNARQVYVDRANNQFVLSFGVADVAQTSYKFNWHAIGNF